MSLFPAEKKCPICKKIFLGYPEWVFRRGEFWFCSNKCIRQWDARKKTRHHNRRLDKDERREVRVLLMEGKTTKEVAEIIGTSPSAIFYYQEKLKSGADIV